MGSFAMSLNASICFGLFAVFMMGIILPDADDFEAAKEDELWRLIWIAPAVIGLVEILLTLFVMRLEPISYLMMMGSNTECEEHLGKVYRKKDASNKESINSILHDMHMSIKS